MPRSSPRRRPTTRGRCRRARTGQWRGPAVHVGHPACGPAERRFRCNDPAGEVGHPGRPLELYLVQPTDRTRHRVEERAEDRRLFAIERGPELGLILAAVVRDPRQLELDRAVEQIAARAQDADAVDDDRAAGVEQRLLVILVEGAGAEAQPGRDPAERVAQPVRDGREVVNGDDGTVGRRNRQVAFVTRRGTGDALVGVDEPTVDIRRVDLAEPCSPLRARIG